MGKLIAISGKGGSGKTTLTSLLIHSFVNNKLAPVLAIDADPNQCLDRNLGMKVKKSVGEIREEARQIVSAKKNMSVDSDKDQGISKKELLEFKIAECLVESDNIDLISMGRPEGAGCYCYANNVIRQVIGELTASYPYVVIDNEAGLENISRRIVRSIDLFILVGDPSFNGLKTIRRLYDLAQEMELKYSRLAVIVNRLRKDDISESQRAILGRMQIDHFLKVPFDEELADLGELGNEIKNISPNNKVLKQINNFVNNLV